MTDGLIKKIEILADSAKYDVSCASSGSSRKNVPGGIGNASRMGICHTFTEDGRCVSLFKILFSNHCLYDCAYCINRRSNSIPRASFTSRELVDITIEFYRRNFIAGLFLSSGVWQSPDYTMELMVRALKDLRLTHKFNGYIHIKSIPGASRELVREAGLYADRMSVNIEIPSVGGLKKLAPEKDHQTIYKPMHYIEEGVRQSVEERKRFRSAPKFSPAGQSTQMIIGASQETDQQILALSSALYRRSSMKRVYYSGFVPVNSYDTRLPALREVPLVRENRLYQADWLMRFYQFRADELATPAHPQLDLEIDPKLAWALRNPAFFPIDINRDDYEHILRVPGIGVKSAKLIVMSRRHNRLTLEHLRKMGVVLKRARFFIECGGDSHSTINEIKPDALRHMLAGKKPNPQLRLF